jgi:poly-gamma-glutamate synthesis protein (capsule biosynthesis protein)
MFLFKRFLSNLAPMPIKRILSSRNRPTLNFAIDSVDEMEFGLSKHEPYLRNILEKIRRAKQVADVVIVLPHIGGQYCDKPGPWQNKVTEAFVSAGADLVIANHAHVPLPIESRGDALVANCLGNFCFMPDAATKSLEGADCSILLNCYFDKAMHRLVDYDGRVLRTLIRGDGVAVPVPTQMEFPWLKKAALNHISA